MSLQIPPIVFFLLIASPRAVSASATVVTVSASASVVRRHGLPAAVPVPQRLSVEDEPAVHAARQHRAGVPNNVAEAHSMWRTCALVVSLTMCMIIFLYWRKGPIVVLKVLVYLGALSTMKGIVKVVEDKYSFKFALFITGTHFATSGLVALAILTRNAFAAGEQLTVPSSKQFATMFVPVAIAFAGSVSMNNMALVHSTSAFVEIVGATSPCVTVLMTIAMGQTIDVRLLAPCLLVFFGCALTSNGEPRFSMIGLLLAAGSNVPRAFKSVLQQLLLQKDSNATSYSPLEVLAWTSLPSSLLMFTWSLVQEGQEPYLQLHRNRSNSNFIGFLVLSCVNACVLNTAILFVIKDLGAVGTQLVAQTKSVLVVVGGMCFLSEQVSRLEFVGFVLVMVGVYTYNDLEARLKAKAKAELASLESQQAASKILSAGGKSQEAK